MEDIEVDIVNMGRRKIKAKRKCELTFSLPPTQSLNCTTFAGSYRSSPRFEKAKVQKQNCFRKHPITIRFVTDLDAIIRVTSCDWEIAAVIEAI